MNIRKLIAVAASALALCALAVSCKNSAKKDGAAAEHYKIGDKGPGGGIVFYYSEEGFPVQDSDDASPVICHYLECSRKEMKNVPWCPCGGCDIKTEDDVGAGKLNTAHIINYAHGGKPLTPSNCAAYACAAYSTKTTKAGEWYLPNGYELRLIYDNLRERGAGKKKKITSNATHWSSSQNDIFCDDAYWLNFKSGMSCSCYRKYFALAVRAVRAF